MVFLAALPRPSAGDDFAYNVLPPGQYGGLPTDVHSTDQIPLYDGLTPLRGDVTVDDIQRLYKPESFTPTGAAIEEPTGRAGLTITRDAFGAHHLHPRAHPQHDAIHGPVHLPAGDQVRRQEAEVTRATVSTGPLGRRGRARGCGGTRCVRG